ncbi:MAG: hypothetical protein M1838_002781 [Thelocarpon superellum]|nr:MAG: hypothetical protein M1838_002781 [Thelocarpon superellum]
MVMLLPSRGMLLGLVVQACAVLALDTSQDVKSISLRTHSIAPPYLDSDMQSRWFDFGGDTIVRADQYIRLTSDRPSQQGWLFSRIPLTATNWEIEVEFRIHGNGHLHGDGMAMWLTKQHGTQGPVFGSADNFEGLGIFFDTYKNNRPGVVFPLVMAMMGDGQATYDNNNDGKANELASCSARGIRGATHPTKARLTYFQDAMLKLDLQYKGPEEWQECFNLSNIKVPSITYLGFSAHTGELSDNHDIIRVETNNLYSADILQPRPGDDGEGGSTRKGRKGPKAWDKGRGDAPRGIGLMGFLLRLSLFILVLGGAYVGYTSWRAQKRRGSRF